MLKRFVVVLSVVLLTACASGKRVTDFTDRSLGYGWLNINNVDANRLHSVSIYQFRPPDDRTLLSGRCQGVQERLSLLLHGASQWVAQDGFRQRPTLPGLPVQQHHLQYSFGKQGSDVGAVVIRTPACITWARTASRRSRPASSSQASLKPRLPPTGHPGVKCSRRS